MFIREHLCQSRKIIDARLEVLDACVDGVDGCVGSVDALGEEGEVVCHVEGRKVWKRKRGGELLCEMC
jgi:hypothetical protein